MPIDFRQFLYDSVEKVMFKAVYFCMTEVYRVYNMFAYIRPKKNICVFQVSRPYLGFWPDPKHFIVLKKKKNIYIYKKKKKKKKMRCGHKTYGSILFLWDRFFFGI